MTTKAWIVGAGMGLVGIALGAALLLGVTYATERIIGWIAFFAGMFGGGGFAFGYRLGGGDRADGLRVKAVGRTAMAFGLVAVIIAYLAPYALFARYGLPFELYLGLLDLNFLDALFVLFGALGGGGAAGFVLKR